MRPPRRADPDHGLRALFHGRLPRVHWQGVELGLMASGVPDTNGCWDGVDFWIEFKHTTTDAVGLEPEQVGWILRRMRAGGRVFVVVEQESAEGPRKGAAIHRLMVFEGWDAADLRSGGLSAVPAVLTIDGPRAGWDWDEVLATLVGWRMSTRSGY